MDRAQSRDFSVSLANPITADYTQGTRQLTADYTQGTRQHVNVLQSRDDMFNLASHGPSQNRQHQQQDGSHDTNRQNLSSNHDLHNKTSSFPSYPTENYPHLHVSQHDNLSNRSKQQDLSGHGSQPSLEYSHRNSPIDTKYPVSSGQGSNYSQSQSAPKPGSNYSQSQSAPKQGSNYAASQTTPKQSYLPINQNIQQQQQKILLDETEQHDFQKGNYNEESHKPVELFYEHEVKKDSELKLSNSDIQYLASAENQSNVYVRGADNQSQIGNTNTSSPSEVAVISQSSDVKIDKSQTGPPNQALHLPSDRAHVCLTCYKTFKNKPQLCQHELVHNGLRKHVCMYCDKAFKQICHLNQHTRVHTGERPYKCVIEGCGRAFAQLSNLNHHMKNHEEHVRRDTSKQYRCEVCDRSYANQNSLHTHIQKLHMNLKATEGSISSPINIDTPPKKRKKKNKQETGIMDDSATLAVNEIAQKYIMRFSNSDDDGLPTQVKTKSHLDLKCNTQTSSHEMEDKNHTGGQKISMSVSSMRQMYGIPTSEKLPDLQHFATYIKSEHGPPMALEQMGQGKNNYETQLSQTYSPGHTPPTTTATKPDNSKQREIQRQPSQREVIGSANTTTTNGSPNSTASFPFLIHSTASITSPPIPSSLFSPVSTLSLQSVTDSFPSQIRHHFPDVFAGSHVERDYRNMAAAQNFFNPAFAEPSSAKSDQNRFR